MTYFVNRNVACSLVLSLLCFTTPCSLLPAQEIKSLSVLTDLNRTPSLKLGLLLLEPSIRKRLAVPEEAYKQLEDVLREQQKLLPSISALTAEDLDKRLLLYRPTLAAAEKADLRTWGMLSEILAPAEMDQLMGIHIGVNGMEAILNRNIAARLRISDEQVKKISEAIEFVRNSKRHALTDLASGKTKPADLELLLPNRTATTSAVRKLLDKKQNDTIDSMLQGFQVSSVGSISFGW
jgi:hypothetical protein